MSHYDNIKNLEIVSKNVNNNTNWSEVKCIDGTRETWTKLQVRYNPNMSFLNVELEENRQKGISEGKCPICGKNMQFTEIKEVNNLEFYATMGCSSCAIEIQEDYFYDLNA